jgi:hypothetical protein
MAGTRQNPDPVKTSKYKNVAYHQNRLRGAGSKNGWWVASVRRDGKRLIQKLYETEREAAKAVDIALIKAGYEPVNDTLQFLGTRKLNPPKI